MVYQVSFTLSPNVKNLKCEKVKNMEQLEIIIIIIIIIFTKKLYNLHEKIFSYLFPPIKPPISTIESGVVLHNVAPCDI
jgi:hypothetical protein